MCWQAQPSGLRSALWGCGCCEKPFAKSAKKFQISLDRTPGLWYYTSRSVLRLTAANHIRTQWDNNVRPKGLEPPAHCLEGSCSIHLSYGRTLLSQWVPLWRQRCVGTGCEKNNTIPIAFCQGKSEKSFNFFALRAKMAVPACRNGLTAATFRHSPAQSPVQSRIPRPAHDAPR